MQPRNEGAGYGNKTEDGRMAFQKGLERLDKAIAAQTKLSRKDVHRLFSRGQILVNGQSVRSFDSRVDFENDEVLLEGKPLRLKRYSYLMMNKPAGVVCAVSDAALPTVIDLLPDELRRSGLFPAGRLDKDTTGFVLITNDGDFAHRILSPKSHVPKTYLARLDKPAPEGLVQAFAKGVTLPPERGEQRGSAPEKRRETRCLPAQLSFVGEDRTAARVVIRQGVYHQVKRMFSAFGLTVTSLRREKIGGLALDPGLEPGKCRELSKIEVESIEG